MRKHSTINFTRDLISLRQVLNFRASPFGTALYGREVARRRAPFLTLRGHVSALTGDDRFCNRIAAVKPLFLLCLASQVDPKGSLVAGNRDGENAPEP